TTTWIRNPSTIYRISSDNEVSGILCTPPSSPSILGILFPELAGLEQDDVFPSVLCASAKECSLDMDDTLTEVSQI
ncbi:hypothetical protein, partial [Sansalvadorimonas verongulae]|uniref:hypothetical protein n=1 Tax=Sansalvadorimonas verongulae TaxID=2172824 RepID=UPI001E5CE0E8